MELAKLLPDKWNCHIVSPIEGTFGYLAPEYFIHGVFNEKINVFAYGVLLLELITGRRVVHSCRKSLVIWAKSLLDSNNMKELIDHSLTDTYDSDCNFCCFNVYSPPLYCSIYYELGRKRVNNDKGTHPAKRAKVEGNMTAELPILVEGEAAEPCDGEINNLRISTCDKSKEEEAALSDDGLNKLRTQTDGNAERGDEVNRLRGLLADDPKKLSSKDVEDVIRYLEVDDIVSLALKSGRGKGSDDGDTDEKWTKADDSCVARSYGEVFVILRLMLSCIENMTGVDIWQLYMNLPHKAFALLLLMALDSYSNRCGVPFLKVEDRDMVPKLCAVLPWKLFAHILSYKASLPLLKYTSEEEDEVCTPAEKEADEVCTPAEKEAAERCEICLGKGKHSGCDGYFCSFLDSVPIGFIVGSNYWVVCRDCGTENYSPVVDCVLCGSEVGTAVPIPTFLLAKTEKRLEDDL